MTSASGADERTVQEGKLLVNHLHVLMKTAQIHEPTNVALERSLADFMRVLRGGGLTEEAHLRVRGEHLYCGETRLKMDIEGLHSLLWIIEEMQKRELGGILFTEDARAEDIKRFAYLFVQFDTKAAHPFEEFSEEMTRSGISGVELKKLREEKVAVKDAPQDLKQLAKDTYARAIVAATEVANDAKLGKAVGFRKSKRLVQSLVELLFQEEHTLLGLTTLRCHDEYTHNHSVNVCILALMLASRLGYSKKQLGDMGVAFLFHDLGKVHIPLEVLNKPSSFSEEEWQIMRTHPIQGVKTVIRLKGFEDPLISMMVTAAFEHHLGYDGTGYPKLVTPWQQSLIGRMVTIADCYDAMTASRVYHRVPSSPEKALQIMLEQSGKALDPTLLKIFINGVGIYPIGALVLLDTGELAVVVQANPNPKRMDRPKVRIVTNRAGDEIEGGVMDLTEREDASGRYRWSILKTVDSTKHGVDVSRYFL